MTGPWRAHDNDDWKKAEKEEYPYPFGHVAIPDTALLSREASYTVLTVVRQLSTTESIRPERFADNRPRFA